MLNGFGDSKISPSPMLSSPATQLQQIPVPRNKDNRWLEVEVCREHLRQMCRRTDEECKFAHPAPHISVKAQTVISCFDSLKGNCTRAECKYYHPTPQIAKQIMAAGKLNQTLKQAMMMVPQQQVPLFYQPQYQSAALLYPQYNNNLLYQYGALAAQPAPQVLLNYAAAASPLALSAALMSRQSPTVTTAQAHAFQGYHNRKRSIGEVADSWPPTTLWETPAPKRQTMGQLQYRELMATGAPIYMQQYTPTLQHTSQAYQTYDANFNGAFSQPPPGY